MLLRPLVQRIAYGPNQAGLDQTCEQLGVLAPEKPEPDFYQTE